MLIADNLNYRWPSFAIVYLGMSLFDLKISVQDFVTLVEQVASWSSNGVKDSLLRAVNPYLVTHVSLAFHVYDGVIFFARRCA